jgi:hypothetical protein
LFQPDELPQRFWQRRFYDFNVFTEKKRIEKLRYMHRNPVKRGLAEKPEDWRWSSFRQYASGEKGWWRSMPCFRPTGQCLRDERPHKQNRLVWGTPIVYVRPEGSCVGHPPFNPKKYSALGRSMWHQADCGASQCQ